MKKVFLLLTAVLLICGLCLQAAAEEPGMSNVGSSQDMLPALYCILAVGLILLMICILVTLTKPFTRGSGSRVHPVIVIALYMVTALEFYFIFSGYQTYAALVEEEQYQLQLEAMATVPTDPVETEPVETEPEVTDPAETEPVETEPVETMPPFEAQQSIYSNPENFEMTWEIIVGDEIVESYTRENPIHFSDGKDYFALPGVATFRGNNYRNNPTYGTANIKKETIEIMWNYPIGRFNDWGGCAWTGQPLLVQWDEETKAIMNLYESKKEKKDLVEVIYATLDGRIHFFDLEDGSETRKSIYMGMNFKGAGAVDPRGYPLLYVGAGLYNNGKAPRMYVISLIDGKILYEYGNNDSFIGRHWTAFDSSPILHAETDTLIWPGESGLLYTITLNTEYDKEAGTISVNPDPPVRTRYSSWYSEVDNRYLGYESSAVVVDHYLYLSENGGLFHCIDLNTMELVWAQDTRDDSNSSPLFEWSEDGSTGYIYTAPSLHWTTKGNAGTISIYKLDAKTGNVIWEYPVDCVRYDDIAGGVQSSPLMGREGSDIEDLVIYSISRTPSAYKGLLTAFNKETGEVVWEISTGNYAWSSPVALYNEDGKSYIFLSNHSGIARLIDGATGKILSTYDISQTVEASPVVFNNMLVLGSREGVFGIKIS